MKTFVECSRVTIWVPTKEGKFCNVPNLNKIPGCSKASSAVKSLVRRWHNMSFDIVDYYGCEVTVLKEIQEMVQKMLNIILIYRLKKTILS